MIAKIPDEKLANPYTKNFSQMKADSFKNQYLTDSKTQQSESIKSPAVQKKATKPTLTPLAQLRERAQQNKASKAPTFKEYNPVLSGRRDRSKTPTKIRDYKGKLEAHSDTESDYSGDSYKKRQALSSAQARKEKPEPYAFVNNFLSQKGILQEAAPVVSKPEENKVVNRYVPWHKRNK